MDETEFWSLIEDAQQAREPTGDVLRRRLATLPRESIASFDSWVRAYVAALRRRDLWAAAYLVLDGCSDDAFTYVRAWLVAQGRGPLERVLRDPEALTDYDDGELQYEGMLSIASEAHELAYGEPLMAHAARPRVEIADRASWPADRIEADVAWTDAFLRERYPRLWARYGEPRARPARPTGSIDHDRFWALIDEARASRTEPGADATAKRLVELLSTSAKSELVGFGRWLAAYNQALVREDVRALARVAYGAEDVERFAGFRGWLLAQGRAVVETVLRDPDSMAAMRGDRLSRCRAMLHVATDAAQRIGTYHSIAPHDLETIPGQDTWRPDSPPVHGRYEAAALRALLPRLTKSRTDEQLTGPYVPAALSREERTERARELLTRAREHVARGERALARSRLDEVLRLTPSSAEAHHLRARLHLDESELALALADLDAAARHAPQAKVVAFERAKVLLALGRRDEALAEGERALALGHAPAQDWLARHRAVLG